MRYEIQVELSGARPARLRYRHREREVLRLLDAWRYGGRWWRLESPRDYFLLELRGRLSVEIYREEPGLRWILSRVSD